MLRFVSLAFKNTLRNRRRSLLTICSIAVSLCLLGTLLAMYRALFFSQQTPGQAIRLIVRHKVSLAQAIPRSYEEKIRRVPGVVELSPWLWFGGTYKDARDTKNFFARFAVDPKAFLRLRTQLEIDGPTKEQFVREKSACIVDASLAKRLGMKNGDKVALKGDIYPVDLELTVAGTFSDPDAQDAMFFNVEYLRDSLPVARRSFDSVIAVLADSPESVPRIAKQVDAMFANASPPTKSESEQQFALSFVSFLGNIKLFLAAISAAVTFTILLVSANTMAMSVRERIREVGVLKTLGFTNNNILSIIIGEAIAIALIGGVLGTLIASFLSTAVGRAGAANIQQLRNMAVTPSTAAICIATALLLGFLSSCVPAWNAARTDILDSLKYAG